MEALRLRLRTRLRARAKSSVALVLAVAIPIAVALTIAGGAIRTLSAPDRYTAAQGDPSQADDWIARIGQGDALGTVVPFVAISTVRVRVEVLRKGGWVVVSTLAFLPPMGC